MLTSLKTYCKKTLFVWLSITVCRQFSRQQNALIRVGNERIDCVSDEHRPARPRAQWIRALLA
jgi:hypothetical protein